MIQVNNREEYLRTLKGHLPGYSLGVEIGVLRGDFATQILSILNPAQLTLVDPFSINKITYNEGLGYLPSAYSTDEDYESVCLRFINELGKRRVSVERMYSHEAAKQYVDGIFDFVYLDASHLYEDVKQDLNDWLPKLKQGGLMCGHDYIHHESFGVIQAVDEFIKQHNFEMIILNENGGDFALKAI